jgi:rare lipoprotein A
MNFNKTTKYLWIICAFFTLSFTVNSFLQKGTASYYSAKLEGRGTFSGERFSNDSLRAAHKTLPMGTWVKITNLKNDSVVIVRINDRMGKSSPHIIDLTQKAAKQLNFIGKGIASVTIEEIQNPFQPTISDSLINTQEK